MDDSGAQATRRGECLLDHPRIREQIVHEIQKEFSGKVVWGEDLMRLTLAGPVVAGIEGY